MSDGNYNSRLIFQHRKNRIAQAIISSLILTPLWLHAAEQSSNEAEQEIEVLEVTAQKRVQNIMKVPVTVDSISNEEIKQSGSVMLADIDKFIPGFDFSDGDVTQAGVTMRGVSSPNISVGGDPSTATFFDGVYMPRAAQNVLFSDMQRVEVLKGPQGTLFGKNAAMGVVNMIPNAPEDDNTGFIKGSFGTDNLQRIEGMWNVALSDDVYLRVNGLSNMQDGYIKNVANSNLPGKKAKDAGQKDHQALRAALKWQVSSSTDLQLSYDWDQVEQAPGAAIGLSPYAENPTDPFADTFANDVVNGNESRDMSAVTVKLNHEFDDHWSMMLISSKREWQTTNRIDEDGTQDVTRYLDTDNQEDSDIFYNELQINYNTNNFNYVGGLTYSKEDVHQTTFISTTTDTAARLVSGQLNDQIAAGVRQEFANSVGVAPENVPQETVDYLLGLYGLPLEHIWDADQWATTLNVMGVAGDIMNYLAAIGAVPPGTPLTADIVALTGDATYDIVAQQLGIAEIFGPSYAGQMWSENFINTGDFTSYGVYSDFDFQITDQWNVFFGLRYSKDEKDFSWQVSQTQFAQVRPGVGNILFPAREQLEQSKSWSKTTGRLGTGYIINDDHMVFASIATGYKAGGFDSLNSPHSESDGSILLDPATGQVLDVSFAPEESLNYEIGYKGVLFEEIVTTLSLFHNVLDDRQVSKNSKPPEQAQALPTIVNEDMVIDGFELSMNWQMTDTFSTGFVTEVRNVDVETEAFYNDVGTLIEAGTAKSDTNSSYTLVADWMPAVSEGFAIVHLDYVFRENGRGLEIGNDEWVNSIPHYFDDTKLLNARISWISDDESLEIGLWGKNLLDNRYPGTVGGRTKDVLGTGTTSVNKGLEAGIDVKYMF
ncbi:TonB-dependent receptor [Thalassotalea sp. G2M2-11]|uniref:TonB-dependent receptor n=1 Tax=Thalassotalea sp. G2M2-11 TaxID=2787627 RepID=UPI0019D01F87|nr:TonB-dependent receptor [Thalassotalea sp. G2M2-11]